MIDQFEYDFSNYSLTTFVNHVEKMLRREILIQDQTHLEEVCGMWITDRTREIERIIVNAKLQGYLYEVTILHELGHILFPKHKTVDISELENALENEQLPILCRKLYKSGTAMREEREAECFAHTVLRRAHGSVVEAHFG